LTSKHEDLSIKIVLTATRGLAKDVENATVQTIRTKASARLKK